MMMNTLSAETQPHRMPNAPLPDLSEPGEEEIRRIQRTMVVKLAEDDSNAAEELELKHFAAQNVLEDLIGRAGTVFSVHKHTFGIVLYGTRKELTDEAMERLGTFLDSCLAKYAKVRVRIGIGDPMDTFLDLNKSLAAALHAVECRSSRCAADATHPFVEEAKALLRRNCGDGVSLKSIAKQLFVNPAYLGRLFKSYAAVSFNDYLVQVRMEKAKELLMTTDMKIYEIAHEVGYRQLDWFYKKFKEYTGYSAKEFKSRRL
ncbi:helix-turn-helix transcriptional regulator [Cohnella thermotolerans]|jgi:AraC-like DNA-binding protein|uniref:helix-turn-helix transcriptional regulator n=1 Tax=Cohnella thermotolerans TaxID=329858 RepID=UPI0004284E9C|nr:helix-turn-helix domain-containing protein [Cohnella thermotolerans]